MRILGTALLVILLGQAVGLPVLGGPCALAQCAGDEQGDCIVPCAACVCCAPVRVATPLTVALAAVSFTPEHLVMEHDTIPPDSPPHEILHVPKA